MKLPLIIYGAGGLGRELLSFIRMMEDYEVIGFVDDLVKEESVKGIPVLGGVEYLNALKTSTYVVLAFGDPVMKSRKIAEIKSKQVRYPVLIHPNAIVQDMDSVSIGEGSVICAGAILTTDIRIGNHVLINLNCTIGHDVVIGDCSSLMPAVNLAGNVVIGSDVLVGAGASIINKVTVGDGCKIGMGSVVIREVEPDTMVAGVPARMIVSTPQPRQA